jgi:hypothetical protein
MKTKQAQKTRTRKLIAVALAATMVMHFQSSFATSHGPSENGTEFKKISAIDRIKTDCKSSESTIILAFRASSSLPNHTKSVVKIVSEEVVQEKNLKIESWMISNKNFEMNSPNPEASSEKVLTLESWMTSQKIWNY